MEGGRDEAHKQRSVRRPQGLGGRERGVAWGMPRVTEKKGQKGGVRGKVWKKKEVGGIELWKRYPERSVRLSKCGGMKEKGEEEGKQGKARVGGRSGRERG
eukprot:scaffold209589_cov35-Tisochrysis_lutea.AAC.1